MADRTFLDWPFFDDGHRRLAAELDAWAAAKVATLAHGDDLDAASRGLVTALGDAGWLEYCVPAAHGGRFPEFDVRSLCLVREILAHHAGLADFAFAMQGLGSASIALFGEAALQERYLPDVATGARIAAFAISEPEGGSDVANLRMTATAAGDSYVLNGTKTWISNAGLADQYVVFARTGEAPGAKGLSAFVVDADAPGLTVPERIDVIAPHPLGTLAFADCRVPANQRLGEPGGRLQGGDGDTGYLPADGWRGGAGLRPAGAGRGLGPRGRAGGVRQDAGRAAANPGQARRHGGRGRRRRRC